MNFEQVWQYADAIPGSFTRLSAEKLWNHALKPMRLMVEIGVDQGRSASILLHAARITGAEVALIDSWESCLVENKAKVQRMIDRDFSDVRTNIYFMRSREAAPLFEAGEAGLIHIDANHYDLGPREDFEAWSPILSKGGVILCHDYGHTFPAVTEMVDECMAGWEQLGEWDGLAIRRKP